MSETEFCETSRHHELVADCELPDHKHCERCGRCYTCEEVRQRRAVYSEEKAILAIVTCILSLALSVIADAQPAPPAVRLTSVTCMTIGGRVMCSPEWAFVAVRIKPAEEPVPEIMADGTVGWGLSRIVSRPIIVDGGTSATTARVVWESDPGVRDGERVVLPVPAGGKLRVRIVGLGCVYPADCSTIDVSAIPERAVEP